MTHELVGKYVLIDAKVFWTKGLVVGYNDDPWDRDDLDEKRFFIVEGHDEAGNTGIHRLREDELELDPEQDYFFPTEDDETDWENLEGDDLIGTKVSLHLFDFIGCIDSYDAETDLYHVSHNTDPYSDEVYLVKRDEFNIIEDTE